MLPVQSLADPEELIGAFSWMMEREDDIRNTLQAIIPDYCKKAAEAGEELCRLWKSLHESSEEDA